MKVQLGWLKEFVDVAVEPARLAEDLTLVGLAVDGIEGSGDAAVLDIDVTTNRVDCMNVYGVAREVSVVYGAPLRAPEVSFPETGTPASEALSVRIEAPDLCPRFCARVLDVTMGEAPAWMKERLEAAGVRSISNLVDLTNYVMLEVGHPSHAFDLDLVPEHTLVVRWAREGERLTTLDGVERTLTPRQGVVACPQGGLALAGVMGGASSEVSDRTRTVALEAAYWDPPSIRKAARGLGMHTEASHRFERGADPNGPLLALARIAHLLVKTGAGSVRPGLIDVHPAPRPVRSALLRPRRLALVLGTPVPEQRASTILQGLGFRAGAAEGEGRRYEVPSWRGDVAREVDLIEEVGRHHGLDKIPSAIPPTARLEGLRPAQKSDRAVRQYLAAAGLTEVVTYAFVNAALAGQDDGRRAALANPLSEEQGILRTSLLQPGLLQALAANLRQGRRDVRLFEVGRVFARREKGLPQETRRLAVLWAGAAEPAHWSHKGRSVDVFDVSGLLEGLGRRLAARLEVVPAAAPAPFLHPGQAAVLRLGERELGTFGAVHPDLARTWELRDETVVAELDLEPLLEPRGAVRVRPLPRFPGTTRDLSLLVPTSTSAAELVSWLRAAGGEILAEVAIADRYDRPPVPEGKVSLTLTLSYLNPARTLTGEEVQASVDAVVVSLKSRGVEIRGA